MLPFTAPVFDDFFHQLATRSVAQENNSLKISANVCNKYTFSDIFPPTFTSNIHVHESNTNSLLPVAFFADSSSSTQFIPELHLPHIVTPPSPLLNPPSPIRSPPLHTKRKKHNTFCYLPTILQKEEEHVANVAIPSTFPILEETSEVIQPKSNEMHTRFIQYITYLVYICTTPFVSLYSFVTFYLFFSSAILWDTVINFYTTPTPLKRQLRRRFKVKHTIPRWFLYRLPKRWMILTCIMIPQVLSPPFSNHIRQIKDTHSRITNITTMVHLSPGVLKQYQAIRLTELMSISSSKQNSKTPSPIPSNQTSLNLLHVEEFTQTSKMIDCRFNKVDSDFISCEAYNVLTNENSFIDCANGMIDCFPIIFDSGASLAITPFKDDFTNDIQIPEKELQLGGLAQGLSIKGKGTVKWSFQSPEGN